MKVVLKDNRRYILRFDKGEEVFSKLSEFLTQEGIGASAFNGIGACSEVELGYFNLHLKDYRKKPFYEELEMVSLVGNSCVVEGKPFIHAHGMFTRTDFSSLGGHVFKVLVSATCEIFLVKLEGQMTRKMNEETGLKFLD